MRVTILWFLSRSNCSHVAPLIPVAARPETTRAVAALALARITALHEGQIEGRGA
jgi:hypothetical protein